MIKFKKVKTPLLIVAEIGLVLTAAAGLVSCDNEVSTNEPPITQTQDKTKEFNTKLAEFKNTIENFHGLATQTDRQEVYNQYSALLALKPTGDSKAELQSSMVTFIEQNYTMGYLKLRDQNYAHFILFKNTESSTINVIEYVSPINVKGLFTKTITEGDKRTLSAGQGTITDTFDVSTKFTELKAANTVIEYDKALDMFYLNTRTETKSIVSKFGFNGNFASAYEYKETDLATKETIIYQYNGSVAKKDTFDDWFSNWYTPIFESQSEDGIEYENQ